MSSERWNMFDAGGHCYERGVGAEDRFVALAREQGFAVALPTEAQNIREHWDARIERGSESYLTDVKAMKRISRRDAEPQDEWLWVELHSVRRGDRGWLYDGHADLLAFELRGSFLLVRRTEMIDLMERLVVPPHQSGGLDPMCTIEP